MKKNEDLRITRLVLNHVGVFEHLDISFEKKELKNKAEIHLFTGENGTGKTTLLEALTYFDRVYNPFLKEQREKRSFYNLEYKMHSIEDDTFAINIFFDKKNIKFLHSKWGLPPEIPLEPFSAYYSGESSFLIRDTNNLYHFFAYSGNRLLTYNGVLMLRQFEFNPIAEALTFNKINSNDNLFQWIANLKARTALFLQKGDRPNAIKYSRSIERIERAIGEIIGHKLEFIIDESSLDIVVKLEDNSVHYNSLADGYKSVISWMTDLMFRLDYLPEECREYFTLFLDEIDVHLHPAAQRRILPVIQKLFPKAQIFLTTHSPFVIGSVDDAWVYKFKLDEKGKSVLDGQPFLTKDANSYQYILEDVFDIKKQFGVEIELQLDQFYQMREKVLREPNETNIKKITKKGFELASQSIELQSIIGSELRQLSRILKKEISM